ncbi:MAG TPA: hypothetical protein PL155_06410 [Candidatus Omnitrophota bacterium]|nr:hypothetical protein [Candidatus Omnitrophota bacterium]HPD83889.1 hypothetical protein [Candidatus Omnitrophota bacterium]HRZ02746.1 hypothetical protein [Candidatus Omnitrophota bacterium]
MNSKNLVIIVFLCALVLGNGKGAWAKCSCESDGIDTDQDLKKFMSLRQKLANTVKESKRKEINFAIAEYYFKANSFVDAKREFEAYALQDSGGITDLLARIYLYKIAQSKKDETRMADLKKEIFRDQFILLFDQYKTKQYVSLLGNKYEIRHFVDKIEVFLNGDIFEQVSP